MKINVLFLFLLVHVVFLSYGESIACGSKSCRIQKLKKSQQILTLEEASGLVDIHIRREYWYYLFNAKILYETNIDSSHRFILFYIYRNIYGTFLCIGYLSKKDKIIHIKVMMRLGNGSEEKMMNEFPLEISPSLLSFHLSQGQHKISQTQDGKFTMAQSIVSLEEGKLNLKELEAKIQSVDSALREKYWYLIKQATLGNKDNILTNSSFYVLLTYFNQKQTYFGLCACDKQNYISINAFVKLGDTIKKTPEYPIIKMRPIVFTLE